MALINESIRTKSKNKAGYDVLIMSLLSSSPNNVQDISVTVQRLKVWQWLNHCSSSVY